MGPLSMFELLRSACFSVLFWGPNTRQEPAKRKPEAPVTRFFGYLGASIEEAPRGL